MTVPTEPLLIGGRPVYVKFFAMPRQADDPKRIEGTFTLVGSEGVLTLDAIVGPQGIPGEPSPIIRPEWGSPVEDPDDLPDTDVLDESDDGRAWYIDGAWHVYSHNDGDYHVIQGSIPGPEGATPDVGMSAEIVEPEDLNVYGPIDVIESGTSIAPHFHFKIPGIPGPEGPSAAIETASDYNDDVSAEPGDFLVFGDDDKWHPGKPTIALPRKYTIPESSFINVNGGSTRSLIATLNLPAMDFDWYPDVLGHVKISRPLFSSAAVQVEVRIGITGASTGENEPMCGLAPNDPTWALLDSAVVATITPHFSSSGEPGRSLSVDSEEGRAYAGDPMTIYVYLRNTSGIGGFSFNKTGAQLRVDVVPAVE